MSTVQLEATRGLDTTTRSWPGLDQNFGNHVRAEYDTPDAIALQRDLSVELTELRGKPCALAYPLLINKQHTARLTRFAKAYHTAIETIIAAWPVDPEVRDILWFSPALQEDIQLDSHAANGRVHLCRLDLHLDTDGGFRVLETNANCPGALMSSGYAGARWREFLTQAQVPLPDPLDHEWSEWTPQWFVENATVETGAPPDLVGLIREDGGNHLELPGFATVFARAGIETLELDPRDVPNVHSHGLRYGYLKFGMQSYARLRNELDSFVNSVQRRNIFVQNGLRGRLIGDNKLCLAILSDPHFEYLFDKDLLTVVRQHIPWSRALAHCPKQVMSDIHKRRSIYVLKHPFDTRGRGVVVGRGLHSDSEWEGYLDKAVRNRWLVQRFYDTTELPHNNENEIERHDLCLGLINGKLSGAFARSGSELRLNLARSGQLHPVFMAR